MADLGSALPTGSTGSAALSAEDRAGLVNALKDKLQHLAGQQSGFLDSLSPAVKNRVSALQEFQDKLQHLAGQQSGFLDSLSPAVKNRVSALQEFQVDKMDRGKRKRSREEDEDATDAATQDTETELVGLPAPPPIKKGGEEVIFILEKAHLEVAKVGKTYQLLNCDDHRHFLRKHKQDLAIFRPDIVHQALLAILDSPLNKSGRVSAVYVQTQKKVLIQVNPHVRLPRTFKRFCGLMVQLLQKLSIRATNGPDKLLHVIKNPVTKYLPSEAHRIGLSYSAPKVVKLHDYVAASTDKIPLIFVVGAMAHGKIDVDYIDDFISISEYPLSAACCIGRICNAVEQKWKIL